MATTTQTTAVTTKPKDPNAEKRLTIRNLFEQQRPELSKLLPRGMDLDRFYRIALTECTKNPKLMQCSAESWALALQKCVAQGLYPNSDLGLMYLIPRENSKKRDGGWFKVWEVSAQRGYQGDILLARNSGEIADIWAEVVYAKDVFKVRKGLDRAIEHEPFLGDEDPGALTHCYAVAKLKSGETAWVHLTKRDVDRHKKSAFNVDDAKSPWVLHTAEMWKKTAIHALAKWLPKSPENVEMLMRDDDQGRSGEPPISIEAVSSMSLPVGDTRPALEGVKDRLRGIPATTDAPEGVDASTGEVIDEPATEEAEAPASREPGDDDGVEEAAALFTDAKPIDCIHPGVSRPVPKGKARVCNDCRAEVRD